MRAPNEDRQGKLHGEPGLRIKEKIELAHDLEATLSSNVSTTFLVVCLVYRTFSLQQTPLT
jgi:hypothetical protein